MSGTQLPHSWTPQGDVDAKHSTDHCWDATRNSCHKRGHSIGDRCSTGYWCDCGGCREFAEGATQGTDSNEWKRSRLNARAIAGTGVASCLLIHAAMFQWCTNGFCMFHMGMHVCLQSLLQRVKLHSVGVKMSRLSEDTTKNIQWASCLAWNQKKAAVVILTWWEVSDSPSEHVSVTLLSRIENCWVLTTRARCPSPMLLLQVKL